MAHSVFISYSSQDKKVADAVCATLEHRKVRCWIAPRDVLSGIPYAEALIRAINESSIMVLVFSASSNDSPQVMREVERAVDKGLPIIPFRIENVIPSKAMEYYLSAPHWLDAITPPIEKHLRKLADTVHALLAEIEKPHTGEEEKEETTTKPETKTTTGKSRKGLYAAAGIVVIAVIIVVIILAMGGSGDDEEGDIAGLAATTTPGGTTATTTPGETTTSTPPTTSGATPAGTTTTPPGVTTTTDGSTTAPSGISQTATPLQAGTSIEGELTFIGEVHWYTFDVEEGDAVYIVLTQGIAGSEMDPWLGLLAPDGSVVYEHYSSQFVQIDRQITQSGTYTVRVRDHALTTGPYVLSFSQLSEMVNHVSPGSIQGELRFPGDVHWYTFEGKEGDAVYIVLTQGTEGSLMDPWLGLLSPDGSVVYEHYSSQSVQIDRSLPETGTYIIRVRDHELVGGTYTLSFSMLSNP